MSDADTLKEAKQAFSIVAEAEEPNRKTAIEDIKFARLGGDEQWTVNGTNWAQKRRDKGRPVITINMLPKFQRQVMNDIRQNRPAIKVRPADSFADVKTAEVFTGLIRNIEQTSRADTAYDTAAEHAITGGFGYIGVNVKYAGDDTFDQDIVIERKPNPLNIYGDPFDLGADSSEWNSAFETELIPKDEFERRFKDAAAQNWDSGDYRDLTSPWRVENEVLIARWWRREPVKKKVLKLSDGRVVAAEDFARKIDGVSMADMCAVQGITVTATRDAPGYRVTHTLLTGAEVLEDRVAWPGRYIPLIPVYGEDVVIDGRRVLKSLIRDARDPQMQANYWRTYAAEMIALAPKAPHIGAVGQFDTDPNWATANTDNHPYLEYDPVPGMPPPQRQPPVMISPGAMQLAATATDDIKSTLGLFDASLGARSNETSGKAIMARQREGDVSTFHFADNLSRAIRHVGAIVLDLIPKVYSGERMVRVLGEDGKAQTVQLGPRPAAPPMAAPGPMPPQMMPPQPPQAAPQAPQGVPGMPGAPMAPYGLPDAPSGQEAAIPPQVFDLTAGKYDLVVQAGPSYTTRREETAAVLTDIMRALPQSVAVLGPIALKAMDVPGIEEVTDQLKQVAAQSKPPDPAQAKMAEVQANAAAKQAELQAQAQHDMARMQMDMAAKQKAAENDMQIALIKVENDKQVAFRKAEMDAEIAAYKANVDAAAKVRAAQIQGAASMMQQPPGTA